MLAIESKNQNKENRGNTFNTFLFIKIIRVCERRYIRFAPKNIPEEENAWAIIILKEAHNPINENVKNLAITRLIWATEE